MEVWQEESSNVGTSVVASEQTKKMKELEVLIVDKLADISDLVINKEPHVT